MIKYNLECKKGHTFDAWFSNSEAFDRQAKRKLVACPDCGSTSVMKSIMAPNVSTKKGSSQELVPGNLAQEHTQQVDSAGTPNLPSQSDKLLNSQPLGEVVAARQHVIETLRQMRKVITDNSEYVGPRFAEEARKIHYKETEEKGIYGEATPEDVKELVEEGIECHPLPTLPEDQN